MTIKLQKHKSNQFLNSEERNVKVQRRGKEKQCAWGQSFYYDKGPFTFKLSCRKIGHIWNRIKNMERFEIYYKYKIHLSFMFEATML